MKIISFDAETNGLWGQAFAIGAIVLIDGVETARFLGRCPIEGAVNPWVAENVLPALATVAETHAGYDALLADFAQFYLAHKDEAAVVVHIGMPVEAKLLLDLHSAGHIGDWDGPYPLFDTAHGLRQAGEDPTSVDLYVRKFGLAIRETGASHHPLYDSEAIARVFIHLEARKTASYGRD